ncbi:MAG: FecR family protein, partial [Acidobacteriota bacterium]|nr:FecR family protein [Acidobacteriota bacterium]
MKQATNILTIIALSLATLPALAVGEDPLAEYQDGYYTGDYARIRYQENEVTIVRGATGDAPAQEELATINSPIYPADSITTYYDQRAEVQLAGGTLIRIDADSQAIFQSMPDPYAEQQDNAIVQLAYGALQLSARASDKEEFRIDTPAASVYLLGDGDYRIEVDEDGRTRVLSRRGIAEVVSEGGSVLVRGGMRTTVYAGFVPDDPHSFNTFVMDDFDRWVRDREGTYRTTERYAQEQTIEPYEDLPTEVRPYYRELSSHGRWVWVADHGYGWIPSGVSSGWRPYHRGYWNYGPGGYFWVSYEPWGWAPYHYGRWDWVVGYGWVWIPGRVFSGAWVTWSYGPSYLGWCPLGVYNYPVRVGGVSFGFYGRDSWTFVSYTNLRHRRVHQYAVRVDHLADEIDRHAVLTRPPEASPRNLGGDPRTRQREVTEARNNTRDRVPRA